MTESRFYQSAFIVSISVILDQLSKLAVELYLPLQGIQPLFTSTALFRTWNEGVAFSFLSSFGSWGLVALSCVVVLLVSWLWYSSPKERTLLNAGYAMIVGGAIGNIIDRAAYGHVVDFILLYYKDWSFAIFNIADSFITIGVILIIYDEFRANSKKETNA
tara:strand:+ start:1072 stop:1554 length:483 start_codon:yes stop_codon:yes gene_type:complete